MTDILFDDRQLELQRNRRNGRRDERTDEEESK